LEVIMDPVLIFVVGLFVGLLLAMAIQAVRR
jgi:hypothetical protein